MSNKRIDQLTAATEITDSAVLAVVLDSEETTKKITRKKLRGFGVYAAKVSQESDSVPSERVLANSFEAISWTRESEGRYTMQNSEGDWDPEKTAVIIGPLKDNGYLVTTFFDGNTLVIETRNGGSKTDDVLQNTFIEIRVY